MAATSRFTGLKNLILVVESRVSHFGAEPLTAVLSVWIPMGVNIYTHICLQSRDKPSSTVSCIGTET